MSFLRFPNPGSNIDRFISTFCTIYNELKDATNFTHDDTRDAAIKHGLVSSSGAIGEEAVRRSTNDNRSIDPLYNQLKMYSELYRLLGWMKPGTMNTNFNFTELSPYAAESPYHIQRQILEESLCSIVFPNPLLNVRNSQKIRPFPLILRVASHLNNLIFRDELIVSIQTIQSDRSGNTIENIIENITHLRSSSEVLKKAKQEVSRKNNIALNTLGNYTRFPLGMMKGLQWFKDGYCKEPYGMKGYFLQQAGFNRLDMISNLIDVRSEDIQMFSLDERGAFTLLTHYMFLERCGFTLYDRDNIIELSKSKCQNLLHTLGIKNARYILYSPAQQSNQEEIDMANHLESSFE